MKKITNDDFENYKSISDLMVSNSQETLAFTLNHACIEDNKYHSDVYLLDLESKALTQVTDTNKTSMAFWYKDMPVVMESDDKSVYLCLVGEDKELLAELPKGASSITYDGNGLIYYLNIFDTNQSKDGDVYRVIDEIPFWLDGFGYSNKKRKRLYVHSIKDGSNKAITDPLTEVYSYKIQKDKVVIVSSTFIDKNVATREILVYDPIQDVLECKLEQGHYAVSGAAYIGRDLVFMGTDMKKYGVKENPCFFKLDGSEATMIHFFDNGYASGINSDTKKGGGYTSLVSDDAYYFLSADGVESSIVTMGLSEMDILKELGTVTCFDLIDGGFVIVSAMKNKLQEVYLIKDGKQDRLTSVNEDFYTDRYIAPMEEFYFEHNKTEMHGMILMPYGYEEDKEYPGILMMHGGPKGIYGRNFMHQMQYMASQGYFVFFTNPVGSCGRGNDFSNITGELGKLDYDIFMKFTDVCLEKYPIDKKNVFVTGGSYGGFMTNWMIGHTHRFNAAVSQRSISNWFSKITSTDIGYYYNTDQMPGTPWTDPDLMWDRSPLKYADKVKTPTLFVHGEKDRRCGLIESQQMFLALKYHGVDSKLLILNDSSHNAMMVGNPQVRKVWLDEMNKWFLKYRV
ncbi:S9 family peptidase [Acidaminobacter sp. JC074]|uniref:alpha/beta hydrolase family protein n=1 Tax=Acidaminobacter sp. JC074 TaxID=2530199 RepID=UPI001F10A94A|nr:S9 family peptidase [Acidaminobacter sp. JC074]